MFIEIERYIGFITKHDINQQQFLFLFLLKKKRYDLMKQYMDAYPTEDGTIIGKVNRDDLLKKGMIIKLDEKETANSYQIGRKFDEIFVDKYEAAREIKEMYPDFLESNGKKYPLTTCDVYEIASLYGERISHEVAEHEEVKKDIEFGIEHGLIKTGLEKFIRSESWLACRKLRFNRAVVVEGDDNNL